MSRHVAVRLALVTDDGLRCEPSCAGRLRSTGCNVYGRIEWSESARRFARHPDCIADEKSAHVSNTERP